ncbi:MAG: hypothetical protein AB1631_30535 [Acidobacteriota bacterium]
MNPEIFIDAALKFFEVARDFLKDLGDRWEFAAGLFVLLFGFSYVSRARPYVTALLIPSLLLLLRKVALFVPISGAISSEDRIVFWSRGAYWYLLIMIAAHALIFLVIVLREEIEWDGGAGCFTFFFAPAGLMVLSSVLLPVDGWSHVYMPFVSLLGAAKAMVVSPLLLPIALVALLIQIGLVIFRTPATGREINKLALILVFAGGLSHFGLQAMPSRAQMAAEIDQKWIGGETSDFLGVWAKKLPEIYTLRLNTVEKSVPDALKPEDTEDFLQKAAPPDWWSNISLRNALATGAGLLLLIALFERFRLRGEKKPAPQQ